MQLKHLFVAASMLVAFTPPAHAEYKCKRTSSSEAFLSAFTSELDRLHAGYKANEATHQARLDAGSKAMIEAGAWSESDKSAFFAALAGDPEFQAQEEQKTHFNGYYQTELQFAFTVGSASPASACDHATNTVSFLVQMIAASEKQWTLMEARLNKAAAEKHLALPAMTPLRAH